MSSQEITGTLKTIPMKFDQTCFQTSAATLEDCPADSSAEVAFAGRSNAGKSSAVNVITSLPQLARTSKTPGRTQLINFFLFKKANTWLTCLGMAMQKFHWKEEISGSSSWKNISDDEKHWWD